MMGRVQCRDFTWVVSEVLTAASVDLLSADQLDAVVLMGASQCDTVWMWAERLQLTNLLRTKVKK